MKKALLMALMISGLSFNAFANDHEDEMDMDHQEEQMDESAQKMKKATQEKMTSKAATQACKKEGKKGKALASCIKSKTSGH